MKLKTKLKQLSAAFLAATLLLIPNLTASAAGSYPSVNMFERSTSIKGVQGAINKNDFGGLQHTLTNVFLDDFIYSPDSSYARNGRVAPYKFEGKTYYFVKESANGMSLAKIANRQDMSVSLVFLLRWKQNGEHGDLTYLIDEESRVPNKRYYAPATTGEGGDTLRAFWHFFMELCIEENCHVDNLILGNEVNMPNSWHYSGPDLSRAANKYADAFYTMWRTVREYTNVSRCSISIDHSWQHNDEGRGIKAREYLETFNARLSQHGDVDWCVSMHPYPAILYETKIWENTYGMNLNTKDDNAQFIDGANLFVMTNYIKNHFGEQHRVMLTEVGFSDEHGAEVQAACLAYTYYAAKYDPMVDSILLHMSNEGRTGDGHSMNFDIHNTLAGEIYSKIDNAEDQEWIASVCLPVIGVSSWEEIIPNFGSFTRSKNGFYFENGCGYLYKDDKVDTSYTGWYTYNGNKYLLVEGVEKAIPSVGQLSADYQGWYMDGNQIYWMDLGNSTALDKEVYDPTTDDWYWFDADGTMATNKDAFIPTKGKWVRYNENGAMVKGEDFKNGSWYRFDYVTGEMIKGWHNTEDGLIYYDLQWGTKVFGGCEIDGIGHLFNKETGVYEGIANLAWINIGGNDYWYEEGIRQGYDPDDKSYRGKEIYDPASDAWYWLDNIDQGKKATSKDLYQESDAGDWAENEDGTGKWVRYDENGHMIKGWHSNENGTYYFDYTYGTMAKGTVEIDGETYTFDEQFGTLIQ